MPTEGKHEIKMMYAVYADGRKEPIVIDEIKDLSMEEAEPILEEHNFVKVTRCKDCKWYTIYEVKSDGTVDKRYKPSFCDLYGKHKKETYFCADGERRK